MSQGLPKPDWSFSFLLETVIHMSDQDVNVNPDPNENDEDDFALEFVDVPSRGRDALEVDDKHIRAFIRNLPNVPKGQGIKVPGMVFKSQSSATGWGNKMKEAIVKATTEMDDEGNPHSPYLNANGDQRLMLTVRQNPGTNEWTCAIQNWDR